MSPERQAAQPPDAQPLDAGAKLERSVEHFESGDYGSAIELLAELISELSAGVSRADTTLMALAHLYRAHALSAVERLEEAAQEYQRAAKIASDPALGMDPIDAAAKIGLADIELELERFDRCASLLDGVIERYGSGATPQVREEVCSARIVRAFVELERGDGVGALLLIDEAVKAERNVDGTAQARCLANAMFSRVQICREIGDEREAARAADGLITRFDSNDDPEVQARYLLTLAIRGELRALNQDYLGACQDLQDLVERGAVTPGLVHPATIASARLARAASMANLDQADAAIAELERLQADLAPVDDPQALEILGQVRSLRGVLLAERGER